MPQVLLRALFARLLSPTHQSKSTRGVYSNPRMRVKSLSIRTLISPLASVLGGTNKRVATSPYMQIWPVVMPMVVSVAYPRTEPSLSGITTTLLPGQSFDPARGMAVQITAPRIVAVSVTTDLST